MPAPELSLPFEPASCRAAIPPRDAENTAPDVEFADPTLGAASYWVCAACAQRVTETHLRMSVDDSFDHTFVNPHGVVYSIRCFSRAPGAAVVGSPSEEFTWFPGYAWQIALCARCLTHIGWAFRGQDSTFFGLISDRLRRVDAPGS